MRNKNIILLAVALFLVMSVTAKATVFQEISYQGILIDNDTVRVNGPTRLIFKIYDSEFGSACWQKDTTIGVVDGVVNVVLGPVTVCDVNQQWWLGIKVFGDANEMSPRIKLTAVPYSMNADLLDGQHASAFSQLGNSIESEEITNGTIADEDVSASANIAPSKISGTAWTSTNDGSGSGLDADLLDGFNSSVFSQLGNSIESSEITDGTIVNADISGSANISASKINDGSGSGLDADLLDGLNSSAFSQLGNSIESEEITDGTIGNVDISASANISPSKISGTAWTSSNDGSGSGLDADLLDGLNSSAFSQLGNSIESPEITDGTIADADISASANISPSKINDGSGSGLDADLLDGLNSSAFSQLGNSIESGEITNGTIADEDVSASANIAPSKISGTAWTSSNDGSGSGLDADLLDGLNSSVFSQLGNSIESGEITDGTIVNADISGSANITPSKINGTAWTGSNDGAGSGLDADLLDGLNSSAFSQLGNSIESGEITDGTIQPQDLQWPFNESGSNPNALLSVENSNGDGIKGGTTRSGYSGVRGEATQSGTTAGVSGNNDNGIGVAGWSSSGKGVYGWTSTGYAGYFDGKVDVTGNTNTFMLQGLNSGAGGGLYGYGGTCSLWPAVYGYSPSSSGLPGVSAKSNSTNYAALQGYNPAFVGILGVTDNQWTYGIIARSKNQASYNPGLAVEGYLLATGNKYTVVKTSEGDKTLCAIESPDVEFYASGTAELINGEAKVIFEMLFVEAISSVVPIKVIVTATGECNGLYVASKAHEGFTVQELAGGTSNVSFDWIAIGRRKGYEERPVASIPSANLKTYKGDD